MGMHLWIVSNGEPLPVDAGPPRLRRMGMLARYLQTHQWQVDWFSSTFHHYLKEQRAAEDREVTVAPGYRIQLIHTPGYPSGVSLARLRYQKIMAARFLARAKNLPDPDIILATLAPLQLSRAAVEYGRERNIPVIIDIRDLWPDIYLERIPELLQPVGRPYVQSIRRGVGRTLAQATGLWGVTDAFLQYGLDLAGRQKRDEDHVFHTSYVPWERTQALADFARFWSPHGLKQDDFLVVFLGSFSRQFILGPVWSAARQLSDRKDIRFVMCGNGPLLSEAQGVARETGNIILPGWVEEPAIQSLLAAAGVGLAPYAHSVNFTLNAPNKFSEYLSGDVPVLVNIPGTMAELLAAYGGGSQYQDAEQLARQICALADDPGFLQQQRHGAARLFAERFSADTVLAAMATALTATGEKK